MPSALSTRRKPARAQVASFACSASFARPRFACAGVTLAAIVTLASLAPSTARAEGLSADETTRLHRGEMVSRPVTLEGEESRYVGGVTYAVVQASVSEIQELFEDVAAYSHVLPRTKRASLVGRRGLDQLVELRQGNAVIDARYTLRVRHEAWRRDVRFWLEPSRPHDIRDAWGYFHVDPLPDSPSGAPRSVVTYGILVDVGPGIVRELFEERVRAVVLSAPDVLRRFVATRHRSPGPG